VQDAAGPSDRLVDGGGPALGGAKVGRDLDAIEVDTDDRPASVPQAPGRGGADARRRAGDDDGAPGGGGVRQRDVP
jgi:hypothetical protein